MAFRVWSNDFKEDGRLPEAQVFNGMGYTGGNKSPHLAWDGAPEGTKSFVVCQGLISLDTDSESFFYATNAYSLANTTGGMLSAEWIRVLL